MDYTVVFDVVQSGYRQWWFAATGLFVTALILRDLFVRRKILTKIQLNAFRIGLGLFLFWTLLAFGGTFGDYERLSSALRSGRCQVTEGSVTDFHPKPYNGGQNEWFVVNGERFKYTDNNVTAGFNQTASHGGPIRQGIQVRIHHVGDEIARLEVAR